MKLPGLSAFFVPWLLAAALNGATDAHAGVGFSRQSLRGYLRLMPGVETGKNFSDPSFNFMVHNRLNYRLELSETLEMRLERPIAHALFEAVGDK